MGKDWYEKKGGIYEPAICSTHTPNVSAPAFDDLLCGNFKLTEQDKALHELAARYHEECEAYDKRVCSGKRGSVAMPVDVREMRLISINARSVRTRIISEANERDIATDAIMRAIQRRNDQKL